MQHPEIASALYGARIGETTFQRLDAEGALPAATAKKLLETLAGCYFLENRGRTVSREELLKKVWRMGIVSSTRTVDVHVACLRQKIEDQPRHPRWILTVHGMGYRFAD